MQAHSTQSGTCRHQAAGGALRTKLYAASQGALTATQSEEPVVPASEFRSLLGQVRELQRLLRSHPNRPRRHRAAEQRDELAPFQVAE